MKYPSTTTITVLAAIVVLYLAICFFEYILYVFLVRPAIEEPFETKESEIDGKGVFATEPYEPDQELFLVVSKTPIEPEDPDERPDVFEQNGVTKTGRYINHCPSHSERLNTYIVEKDDGWYLYSKTNIEQGQELTVDYNVNRPSGMKPPDDTWKC
jgi:hypothetical protein